MENSPTAAELAVQVVWWTSLALGLVVSLVVTLLLWLIYREAGIIHHRVSKIWDIGQRVANNTIHISALYKTNDVGAKILATARDINDGASAIEAHANGCRGCPQCLRH